MKRYNIKMKLAGWCAAIALLIPAAGYAQLGEKVYMNVDWQVNVPLGVSFANKASGWGMNFEAGYYFNRHFGLGAFYSYHTNNQYIPRKTITSCDCSPSSLTTDQIHSVFQEPFGLTGRYRFGCGKVLQPYVALKLGANYARISSDFYIVEAFQKTWGFYCSPEIGVKIAPFTQAGASLGLHIAAYYSVATNRIKLMQSKIDGLSNFGVRVGLCF